LKQILFKGVLLALLLMFLFKGGIRLLIAGWRLFVPMLVITIMYFVVRQIIQQKKLKSKPGNDTIGSGQPITICPHCNKPKGSCPKCQD
jgi:hypothetical protein